LVSQPVLEIRRAHATSAGAPHRSTPPRMARRPPGWGGVG
jgi:hypothetical protein